MDTKIGLIAPLKRILASLQLVALLSLFFWIATPSPSEITSGAYEKNAQRQDANEVGEHQYPSEWAWLQRTFPYFTADPLAHVQALRQAQAIRQLAKATTAVPQWKLAGPTNIGGRVSALAFNPKDSRTVYAGAATGGVFKSTDRGVTWQPIFDDQAVLPIGDIAVDPNNPNVVYAGTGEANGGHNNFPGAGVLKSTDAGATWKLIGLEKTTSIGRLVIDPANSNRIYAAAVGSYFGNGPDRGVYRSSNAGQSWEKVLFVNDSTGAIDLAVNPQNPSVLFAAMWERVRRPNRSRLNGPSSGIYRSMNGGSTWQRLGVANGLPGPAASIGRIGLAICTTKPENLYALYVSSNTYGGLYRSKDGGQSWTATDPNHALDAGFGGFSWYFGNVRVHPTDPERIYVLDVFMMISADGGLTWNSAGTSHVDHHAFAFDPLDPQRQVIGHDGGIDYSTNNGVTWTKVGALPVTQFYHIAMDQTNPERLYGGTQDNGTVRTTSGWLDNWHGIYGGDGFYVIVDPANPNIIYAESQNGALGKSTDGGNSFRSVLAGISSTEPKNWSTPVVMDPNNRNVLYYGSNRVYRTTDGANRWRAISPNLTAGSTGAGLLGTVTTIAVAPSNSAVIYAGTDDSNVWVTADTGKTWSEISAALPLRWVTRVAVDPADAKIAYVTFSGLKWNSPQSHVFRTIDMGKTWQDISGNLPEAPVNTIVVDPTYPRLLYVGTDVGAYYSSNSGQNWAPLGEGLPLVSVYDIVIHPKLRRLVAGTHGRSMYTLDLANLTGIGEPITQNNKLPSSPVLAQNYPNPFRRRAPSAAGRNSETTIEFFLPAAERVSLHIYNLNGRLIRTLVNESRAAGRHLVHWDGRDANGRESASGTYLYRLQVNQRVQQKKLVLVR